MKSRPPFTADKLLSFRERLARHYAAVRNTKGKSVPKPSISEFPEHVQGHAGIIVAQEYEKHCAAVAADESFKRLGYKTI